MSEHVHMLRAICERASFTSVTPNTSPSGPSQSSRPAAISREGDGAAGGEGTSDGEGKGTSGGKGKSKGKGKGKAAGVPRQGGSEAARRVDALEAGDYDATGLEEVDLAERFTQSLLEDASGGY